MRRVISLLLLLFVVGLTMGAQPAAADGCGSLSGDCGVTGESDHFDGVLAVTGDPWVLDLSATSGTTTGCGDCSWSLVPVCVTEHPGQPDTLCGGATAAPTCDPGQVLYRLYLTTNAAFDIDEGALCLGGANQPVGVGDIATGDVGRYLDNVRPPDLTVSTKPERATLAGLVTYFTAGVPGDLRPQPFGGPDVTETITIAPAQSRWRWGDGTSTEWGDVDAPASHTYSSGGVAHGSLATRWKATYTISYAGLTFGPYDANREVDHQQAFQLPVHTSSPVLVSH